MNDLCPYDCTCDGCKVVAVTPQKYTDSTRGLARLYNLKHKKIPQSRDDLKCFEKMFKSSDEEEEEEESVSLPPPPSPAATVAAAEAVAAAAAQVLPPPPLPSPTIDDPEYEWSSDSELAAFMFPLGLPLVVQPSEESDRDDSPISYHQL